MSSENIYKLVEKPKAEERPKGPLYKSKYDPKGPLIGSTFGMECTTVVDGKGVHSIKKTHVVTSSMGLQPEKPDPEQYLRRGTRKDKDRALLPSVEHQTRNREVIKPHLPPVDEKPMQKPPTTKDYVNSNAVEIINSSPKRKEVEIPYNKSLDYGKVPAYLEAVKTEIQKEKMLVETYVIPQTTQERIMDEQERRELIDKLKKRWDDVNAEYSKYCHKVILDTPGEIKRKVSQEAELQQLEDDIQRLSHLGPLVVVEELAVRDKK